ncbi:MAG TPA: hypothetical protein DCQ06_11295 [Myxococcales bacterium]|nr:hypothetical protein [Myxococcales bacterium]
MTQYFATEMITNRFIMEIAAVLITGYLMQQSAGRRWVAPVLVVIGIFTVTYAEGVLTDRGIRDIKMAITGELDAADTRAKAIGTQGHNTSAGDGGKINEHYKKNIGK